jgi:hypothetical protein
MCTSGEEEARLLQDAMEEEAHRELEQMTLHMLVEAVENEQARGAPLAARTRGPTKIATLSDEEWLDRTFDLMSPRNRPILWMTDLMKRLADVTRDNRFTIIAVGRWEYTEQVPLVYRDVWLPCTWVSYLIKGG